MKSGGWEGSWNPFGKESIKGGRAKSMAMTMTMTVCPSPSSTSASALISHSLSRTAFLRFPTTTKPLNSWRQFSVSASASASASTSSVLRALIFDCDGVILESEHLHRQAYNDAFAHFNVRCSPSPHPLNWGSDFYDELQNRIGGGKPKMRWYFSRNFHFFFLSWKILLDF